MPTELRLPELGEGITEADVIRVLVHEGDALQSGQPIATIETEKATVDVPSELTGTVTQVLVREGQAVSPGTVLLMVESASPAAGQDTPAVPAAPAAPTPSAQAEQAPRAPEPAPPAPAPVPASPRQQPQPAATASPPSPPPPTLTPPPAPSAPPAPPSAPAAREGAPPPFAAPSVRLFAREIGVDIHAVRGSGPSGRVDVEDVKRHARERAGAGGIGLAREPLALPDFSPFGPTERQPLSRFRRTVARNMATSATEIPQVTLFNTADLGALEGVRRRYRDAAAKAGGTLTTTVILVKLVALALREFPNFNASLDPETQELVLKRYCHIGLAVETERGLAVAVIRDADQKDLPQIAVDLKGIADRVKENALTLDEMRGASFTISSLETLGVGHFTPLVNWPEVAILGVGRDTDLPSYENDELHPRRRMALSLSLDHRVVDGADGARFLRWLVNAIQDPVILDAPGGAS